MAFPPVKSIDGRGTLAYARELAASIIGATPVAERKAAATIAAALSSVLPKVCRDVEAVHDYFDGRATIDAAGNVTQAHFDISRKGKSGDFDVGYVGDLVFERQNDGRYTAHFSAVVGGRGTDELEYKTVGPTVTLRSLDASAMHAPLTRLFAHGGDVRSAIEGWL